MKNNNAKYNGRHTCAGKKSSRSLKSALTLALAIVLICSIAVGGTLAYLKANTSTVENTFKAGDIKYTLKLEPNAAKANEKYEDSNVSMPSELAAQEKTDLSVVFDPDKDPELTGYTFNGWHYDANCAEDYPHVDEKGDITVNYGDEHDSNEHANKVEITLYAGWTANQYTVKYEPNPGIDSAVTGSTAESTHTYDLAANLTANGFSRTGYKFLGWSEDKNATEPTYTDGESVVNLASVDGATVTLYAIWERMDFTVTFDTQAEDVIADPASKTVTYQMPYGELPVVERDGYTFNGWALDENGTQPVNAESIVNTAKDHSIYAQWTPHTYTVKYLNNVNPDDTSVTQPTGTMEPSTHTYGVEQKLTANGFSRTGYTFTGWNTQADGKGTAYSDGEAVKNLTAEQDGVVTLYAQWGVKTYVLRYHANGGEGEMADQVIEWDKLTILSANTFTNTKGDYNFAGWATEPEGGVVYLDKQQVVNLLESGTLDLYAVWLLNSYTVTFDYNIGWGTPPTKEVLYGEEYGVLPPFLHTKYQYLFKGWYTDPDDGEGERIYPETIVDRKEDHRLWAHWDPSPANDVIKDLVVHSSADDNNDGVADEIHLEFVCSSSFEKFNIPLHNLVPGQKYALTYTASNNASFGDYYKGYKDAVYGSYILDQVSETGGLIQEPIKQDIIATWNNRIEPDGNNDGSQKANNDGWLNGPWKNRTITFNATKSDMYWTWDFGLMEDGIKYDYNIYDISLKPVAPEIKFASKEIVKGGSSVAKVASQTNGAYNTTFEFDGDGGCETIYYPITGLSAGMTYTITFDHQFSGPLIHDTKNNSNPTYEYGCGIMNAKPTKTGDKMSSLGDWASGTQVKKTVDGMTDSWSLTFKATGDTAYWVWNMANCSDGTNTTTKVNVTSFSASNSGKSVTYYSAPSNAGEAVTLSLRDAEVGDIELIWDGIDETNLNEWYPVDEQYPTAGDSYELAFEPAENCSMCEVIVVKIDDVSYDVYTDGLEHRSLAEGETELPPAPSYDPETNILTIPAELLTEETKTVEITASAVLKDGVAEEPEDNSAELPTIETVLNLSNINAQPLNAAKAAEDYKLLVSAAAGYNLPETITVTIDSAIYNVSTVAAAQPGEPGYDAASGTLTIPAALLTEGTRTVTIFGFGIMDVSQFTMPALDMAAMPDMAALEASLPAMAGFVMPADN
ncbi:MAG: InlB B-repeat-containing protein [Oscillospiraceae bacterium]|nr:InlB B-repeat-containing protein [Oscillospiraceae bacterium]